MAVPDNMRQAMKDRLLSAMAEYERRNVDDLLPAARQSVPNLGQDDFVQLIGELADEHLVVAEPVTVDERRLPLDWYVAKLTPTGREQAAAFDRSLLPLAAGQAADEHTDVVGVETLSLSGDSATLQLDQPASSYGRAIAPEVRTDSGPAVTLTLVEVVQIMEPILGAVYALRDRYPLQPEEAEKVDEALDDVAEELRSEQPSRDRLRDRLNRLVRAPLFNTVIGAALGQAVQLAIRHL